MTHLSLLAVPQAHNIYGTYNIRNNSTSFVVLESVLAKQSPLANAVSPNPAQSLSAHAALAEKAL